MTELGLKPLVHGLIGGTVAIAAVLGATQSAVADEYGSVYLGGTQALSWLFTNSSPQHNLVGYACFVSDGLETMSRTTSIYRYEILAADTYLYMRPLKSAMVYREGQQYIKREDVQFIEESELRSRAPMDDQGIWFTGSEEVTPMERACLDGGVAAALQEVERSYGINLP